MSAPASDPPPAVHASSNSSNNSNNSSKRRTFKVIVIGDSGVGKTCLTFRYKLSHHLITFI